MPFPSRTLSIAHEALAVIAGIGLVLVLAIVWGTSDEPNIGALRPLARAATMAAIAFLYASSWLEFRLSDALRAGVAPRAAAWLSLAAQNAAVLFATTLAMMRGERSRAYLSGMNQSLAALGTVTCLGLALAVITWLAQRRAEPRPPAASGRRSPQVWGPWALYAMAALVLAATLGYLESQPLPHGG